MAALRGEGAATTYELAGHGPPLLYLHGWNGSIDSFRRQMVPRLADRFELILLRYLADATMVRRRDLAALSAEPGHVMDELGLDRAVLVGFCLGGVLALDFALRYPDRVSHLILLDVTIDFPLALHGLCVPWLAPPVLRTVLRTRVGHRLVHLGLLQPGLSYGDLFTTLAATDIATSLHLIRLVRDYGRSNHYQRVESLDAALELTVVVGARTSRRVKRSSRRIAAAARGRYVELPEAGHFVVEESPGALAELLCELVPVTPAVASGPYA